MNQPLIVGAGPVGLGAALFLARQGLTARVVEMRSEPSTQSKALAVNPRTLDDPRADRHHGEDAGDGQADPRHADAPQRADRRAVFRSTAFIRSIRSCSHCRRRRPSDCSTKHSSKPVERSSAASSSPSVATSATASKRCSNLRAAANRKTVELPWLLAADGAHSTARRSAQHRFPGLDVQRRVVSGGRAV